MGCEQRRGEQLLVLSETTSESKLDWRRGVACNPRLIRSRVCANRTACDTLLERGHTHRTFLGSRFLDPRPQSVAPGLADKLALDMSILKIDFQGILRCGQFMASHPSSVVRINLRKSYYQPTAPELKVDSAVRQSSQNNPSPQNPGGNHQKAAQKGRMDQ